MENWYLNMNSKLSHGIIWMSSFPIKKISYVKDFPLFLKMQTELFRDKGAQYFQLALKWFWELNMNMHVNLEIELQNKWDKLLKIIRL